MKSPFAAIFLALALNASAATYSSNFSSLGAINSDVNGQDGWTIDDTTDQFSFVASWNSSKAIGLGDVSAVASPPSGSSVRLSHGIGMTVGNTTVNFDFALIDSNNDSGKLNRDKFGISLSNSGNNLITITFVPEIAQPADPNDNSENSGFGAKWFVWYNAGAGPAVQLNMALFEGSTYDFNLELMPNTNPLLTDFMLDITGSNTLSDGATGLSLNPAGTTDQFSLFWSQVDTNAYGSNLILMDNLNLVPEPSSALLLGLAGFGFVFRRKRA